VKLHKIQVAAEAAAEQGSVKGLRKMQTYKNKKFFTNGLFLFSNNVDLKNDNRECRRPF